jgi:hypothetical protein
MNVSLAQDKHLEPSVICLSNFICFIFLLLSQVYLLPVILWHIGLQGQAIAGLVTDA